MVGGVKKRVRDLAIQRARILYGLAIEEVRAGRFDRARRYVEIALRLIQKANARKPTFLRRGICKNCLVPLVPGLTATVRLKGNRKYVIITRKCLLCGWVSRVPCLRKRE